MPAKEAFARLPVEELHCTVDAAHRICPDCGSELVSIGQKLIRQELHYIPAKLSIQNIYAESYECRSCRKAGKPSILQAKTPEPVLQHSYASAATVATTMYQKYVQAVPLNRQEKDWKAMGVDVVTRQVLSNWILRTTEEWLQPVVEYMSQIQKQDHYLHMDETPLQVLKEPGRSNTTKSHMWVIASSEHALKPVRLFSLCSRPRWAVCQRLSQRFFRLSSYRWLCRLQWTGGRQALPMLGPCSARFCRLSQRQE